MLWLRLIHILAGVFWVGSALFTAGILGPAVRAAGPEGASFMQRLMEQRRTRALLGAAAGLTMLSGLVMYGVLSGGPSGGGAWATSPQGIVLGAGGALSIVAAVVGAIGRERSGALVAALLVLAVAAMAMARYL